MLLEEAWDDTEEEDGDISLEEEEESCANAGKMSEPAISTAAPERSKECIERMRKKERTSYFHLKANGLFMRYKSALNQIQRVNIMILLIFRTDKCEL
jgi:hypothetical protein